MLDQDALRTFSKVAEMRSFSLAARALAKTPAAISYRIKVLEQQLGIALFLRTTRSVNLTAAGNYLYEQCQQWLAWHDRLPASLAQISNGVEHQVNLVVNNLLYSTTAATRLLGVLHRRFALTQCHMSCQVYMGVWDNLLHNDCHVAIGVTGYEPLAAGITLLPLGEITWVFVVAPHHPLAACKRVLTNSQLRQFPAINIEDTARHLTRRVAWLLPAQQEIKVPDLSTKLACHLEGTGIGFLPLRLCQPWIERGQLIAKRVQQPRPGSPLSLAWKHPGAGKVVEDIVALFRQHSPEVSDFLAPIDTPAPALFPPPDNYQQTPSWK